MNKFLILGANYDNKGSLAMLLAIDSYIQEKVSDTSELLICYDSLYNGYIPKEKRFLKWTVFQGKRSFAGWLFTLFLAILSALSFGYINLGKTVRNIRSSRLVLDASGFALTDDFSKNSGTRRSVIFLLQVVTAKILGKKHVIAPQAIGPFKRRLNEIIVSLIFRCSDTIFHRGQLRFNGKFERIKVFESQDLTNLLGFCNRFPEISTVDKNRPVIINPNSRIWVKKGQSYFDELLELIRYLKGNNCEVILFPNEEREEEFDDWDLCLQISKELGDVGTFKPSTLDELVELIDNSSLQVVSRFHVMMLCLIRNRAPLVYSWSEKYSDLMSYYGLENQCFGTFPKLMSFLKDNPNLNGLDLVDINKKLSSDMENLMGQIFDTI